MFHKLTKSTLCCVFAHLVSQEGLSGMLGCSLSSFAFHPPRWLAAQGYGQSDLNIQYITVKRHQSMVLHPIKLRAFLTGYFNNNLLFIIMKPIIIKPLQSIQNVDKWLIWKTYDHSLLCISMWLRMSAATASTSNSQVLCFSTSSRTIELQTDVRRGIF